MVKWLVDPSDHHPDDEELLRTGIQAEMATTTRLARVMTGRTTLAERRTAENHLMVRQQARLEPLNERHARKKAQSKKRPSARWQRLSSK